MHAEEKTMRIAILMFAFVSACQAEPVGTLGARCKPDGTCLGEHLRCNAWSECVAENAPPASAGCYREGECFCKRCAESCGADGGMKVCSYTDTSVWGSKPSTCECRQ